MRYEAVVPGAKMEKIRRRGERLRSYKRTDETPLNDRGGETGMKPVIAAAGVLLRVTVERSSLSGRRIGPFRETSRQA